jgi:hypothetical protein
LRRQSRRSNRSEFKHGVSIPRGRLDSPEAGRKTAKKKPARTKEVNKEIEA